MTTEAGMRHDAPEIGRIPDTERTRPVEIRPIDLTDEAERHRAYDAFRTAHLAENPESPLWNEAEMMAHFTDPDDAEDTRIVGAFEGGEVVGCSFWFLPLLDNVDKVYGAISVRPEHRRRGIGTALLDHLVDEVSAAGRSMLLVESAYGFDRRDDHPYRRFAESRGFTVAFTEVGRRLELPVPEERLQAWIDEAAPHHAGYRIETFRNEVPDELLPSVCHVLNQLAKDAPTGEVEFEAEEITPEIRRQHDARNRRTGLTRYETVAIAPDGQAVAVTTIGVPADSNRAHQWATLVLQEHRGRRLGLALKAVNLRTVQREHPERVAIFTSNEETNGPMVDINVRMGFEPMELNVEFQRRLDG